MKAMVRATLRAVWLLRGVVASAGAVCATGDLELAPGAHVARETIVRRWSASEARIENPERGFYRFAELTAEPDLRALRAAGDRLVFSAVRLDAFREAPISEEFLARLDRGLGALRGAGLKAILRFAYNAGPYPDPEPDASLPRVLAHIAQLAPLLRAHADVILLVQAGFLGAWGEWHSSTHGLATPEAKRAALEALLDALPPERMTQVRFPADKQRLYGGPMRDAEAFTASYAARVGFHDDCFLASATDEGTWPAGEEASWQRYVADEARYTPVGGETCRVNPPRTDGPTALAEMARLRFTFVNRDWHPDVVRGWLTQGVDAEIERRLGYRFALVRTSMPSRVLHGLSLRVRVTVRNAGWAAMFNPRPVRLVLASPTANTVLEFTGVDPRRWAPGAATTFAGAFTLPATLARGPHLVALWLPDGSPSLAELPDYAVRFANDDVWDAAHGWNTLGTVLID